MENFDIESIKDAVYEFEGLLELAELREDKIPALLPLMKNKLKIINTLFEESSIEQEELSFPDMETEEETVEGDSFQNEADAKFEDGSEEDEVTSASATTFPEEIMEEPETSIFIHDDSTDAFSMTREEEGIVPVVTTTDPDLSSAVTSEEMPRSLDGITDEPDETSTQSYDEKPKVASNIKPAFCINDRFRFRRELFGNSDAEFNSTMDLVAMMADYEEAEAYFYGEKEWNPEKEEVMDFMAIIRNYFDR